MTDFISYSRADTSFVRRLHDRLAQAQRDVWVDWEDIPLSADWWREIQDGINKSNAFVFIISPDSVQSDVCRDEINYAVNNNKRIVPVMYRDLVNGDDKAALHPSISSHNWIFFRDDDDFEQSFAKLVNALDTDLDHVRDHTRWLVRALEWEASGHNASVLLNGIEITNAESWLRSGMNLQPEPTDLHTQYIFASRIAETRRQRRILVGVTVALVVAIGLAIASFFLFQLSEVRRVQAEAAQLLAEDRGNEARSLALAANARNLINDAENGLGLVLAIAAYQAYEPPRADVQQTLARAIYGPNARFRLEGHSKSVLDVAYSPDGTTGYSVSSDGKLIFWDLRSGAAIKEVTFAGDQIPSNIAVSPDGTQLAVALFDHTIHLLNASDASEITTLTGHNDLIMQVVFSPSGEQLLSGGLDRTLRLWDVATGEEVQRIESVGAILNLAFSPDGRRAVTSSGDSVLTGPEADREIDRTVRVWNLRSGQEMQKFTPNSGFVRAVAFSPDGSSILAGTWNSTDGGRLHLWSILSGDVINTFYGHTDIVTNVAFSPDGRRLLSTSWDRTLRVWDISTALEIQRFQGPQDRLLALAVSPNGEYVLTGTGRAGNEAPNPAVDLAVAPTVWLWDLESRAQIHVLQGHSDWVWGVDISPDDRLAASGSGPLRPPVLDSSVRIWDVATGEQLQRLGGHTDTVQSVRFSPDGTMLASASWDGTVRLWDVATGEGRVGYDGHTDNVLSVILNHDGTIAFSTSADKTIHMWDVATGTEIKRFEGHTGAVNSVDLSPDGMQIVTASDDRTIRLWDIETGTEIKQFIGHSDRINNAVFSPDGTRLMSTSWDTTVREWNIASGEQLHQFVGHNGAVFGVDYSPDGRTALTASSDLTIRLWDTTTGQEIRRFEGHTNWVLSVAFSADGNFALSGAEDNTARLWRVESTLNGLVAWAQNNRYIPELTCAERQQYNVEPFCDENNILPTITPASS